MTPPGSGGSGRKELISLEENGSFSSSLGLGAWKAWGRRGNAAVLVVGGSCHPVPSLAPLTELNELSILSVLEESSWERAGGRGEEGGAGREGKRDKGKEFSSTLDHNCFSCVALPSCFNQGKSIQKCQLAQILDTCRAVGGQAQNLGFIRFVGTRQASIFTLIHSTLS